MNSDASRFAATDERVIKLAPYDFVTQEDEGGMFVAECPALQGCYAQGKTFEEALNNIKDVIVMCIEELREEKKEIDLKYPEVIEIKNMQVAV